MRYRDATVGFAWAAEAKTGINVPGTIVLGDLNDVEIL